MTHTADTITAAIRSERVIRFWFQSQSRPVPMLRTVSPYELAEDGESFLGFDHDRQAIRRFALSGIVSDDIELPDEDYVYPIEKEENQLMTKDNKVDINRKYRTTKGVLRACLRLFEESPSNWTTGKRERIRKSANGGVAFCAVGGIHHFADNYSLAIKARILLSDALPNKNAMVTNDTKGRKAILAGLKKALA